MKKTIRFLFIFTVVFLVACNNRKSTVNTADKPQKAYITIDSAYLHMKTITVPRITDNETVENISGFGSLSNSIFDKLSFSPRYYKDLMAARFNDNENIKAIVVAYKDSLNHPVEELITFKPDFQFADRIQLYGIENVVGKENQQIITESEIKDWNNIIVTKKLNGTLIESLQHKIDSDGSISEIRDGKTPVVAFESFDNETYYIENFIWKTLQNGGLEKSNLTKKTYKIADDGEVREIKP